MSEQTVPSVESRSYVQFSRREKRGVVLGFDWPQIIFIGFGLVLITLFTGVAGGFPAGLVTGLLVGGPFVVVGAVRVADFTLLTWIARLVRFLTAAATGQNDYRRATGAPSQAITRAEARNAVLARAGKSKKDEYVPAKPTRMVLPGEAAEQLCYVMKNGTALVYDPVARTIAVASMIGSDAFGLLDEADQEIRVQLWSQLLVSFSSHPGVQRIQTLDRTVVHPAGDILEHYESMSAANHAGAAINPVADAAYKDLIMSAATHTRHDQYLVIVMSVDRMRRQVRGLGGGIASLMGMVQTEMDAVEADLPLAGARVERWLKPRELAQVIREAYDPASIEEIGSRTGEFSGVSLQSSGPMAANVTWDMLQTDTAVHRTFWISEWPRVQVEAGFISSLTFSGDFVHSVSLVAEPQMTGTALRKIEKELQDANASRNLQKKLGNDETLQQKAEYADIQRREKELVEGHGEVRFSGFVTISGKDKEELAAAEARLRHGAAQANVELRPLYGQQHQAFLVGALPLGRGTQK